MKQLRCPNCGHEFGYDNVYYDRNIERLGNEVRQLQLQLSQYNCLPYYERRARKDWRLRAKEAIDEKLKQLAELKSIRKAADQQLKYAQYQIFRELVRERLGEVEYKKLILEAEKELDAYTISGQMWHEYSRAHGKSVTNINKL